MSRAVLLLLCASLLSPAAASARAAGTAAGCDGCHGGGQLTQPTVTPSNPNPSPGSQITLTVVIPATNGGPGGLHLRANTGTWNLIAGQGTKLLSGGVVHSTPKAPSGGNVTFQVGWTAPAQQGGVDFEAWVLASNGNGASSGDGAGYAHRAIAFGCAGTTYYRDFDGDGWGAAQSGTTVNCAPPAGYSAKSGDCDDNDEKVYPGAAELCDGKDNDCDGDTDEGLAFATFYEDKDGDGWGVAGAGTKTACAPPPGYASKTGDCADDDPTRHPDADEVCNQLDDDCDGQVDEGAKVICGVGWCRRYGPSCNPALCTPGTPEKEICNYLDDDCDGDIDEGAVCPTGQSCQEGQCVAGSAPGSDGGADPWTGDDLPGPPPVSRGASCAQVPMAAPLAVLVLVWVAVRRRALPIVVVAPAGPRRRRTLPGVVVAPAAPLRRRVPAALACALAVLPGGCSSAFESAALGVRWEPPPSIQFAREETGPLPTARFTPGVTLRRVEGDAPRGGAEQLRAEVAELAQLPLAAKILSHRSGSLPAGKVERMELAGEGGERTLLYLVRGEGRFLVLTLTAAPARYGPLENQLERSLASLRFR